MNPFGAKAVQAKPPEKGVFPLDRLGQCKKEAHEFLICLDKNRHDNAACKRLSKIYLECRMNKGLMQQEDLDELGFKDVDKQDGQTRRELPLYDRKKEAEGFLAGVGVKGKHGSGTSK